MLFFPCISDSSLFNIFLYKCSKSCGFYSLKIHMEQSAQMKLKKSKYKQKYSELKELKELLRNHRVWHKLFYSQYSKCWIYQWLALFPSCQISLIVPAILLPSFGCISFHLEICFKNSFFLMKWILCTYLYQNS